MSDEVTYDDASRAVWRLTAHLNRYRTLSPREREETADTLDRLARYLRGGDLTLAVPRPLALVELSAGGIPSLTKTWGDVDVEIFDWQEFNARPALRGSGPHRRTGSDRFAAEYIKEFDPRVVEVLRGYGPGDIDPDTWAEYDRLTGSAGNNEDN